MLAPTTPFKSEPTKEPLESDLRNIAHAIFQGELGLSEGGVPIGAALVRNDGVVIGVGRNRRVQQGSATRHGETDCLENIGRLPASVYENCTMYTTLSPCTMCTGAMILYGIKRCVMGENDTFVGGEGILKDHGVEVVNLNLDSCKNLMKKFVSQSPHIWNEDIGEQD
ncbi:cytosine deaminase [Microbotryomycetes sp. JL201]|nr:cytosine deaminase [Microbotryomycetes sp. JL201]